MNHRTRPPGAGRGVATALFAVALLVTACGGGEAGGTTAAPAAEAASTTGEAASPGSTTVTATGVLSVTSTTVAAAAAGFAADFDEEDLNADEGGADATTITFDGASVEVDGTGVTVLGTTITINAAGTYRLTGTLADGQVVVDAGTNGAVRLVLAGAHLTSATSAPIYVVQADRVVVTLAAGTQSSLTDAACYTYADGVTEPSAALFSNDDLTINGSGALTVAGNYEDGIACDDDLKVTGGTISVTAADDGLRGRDSVAVGGGSVAVTAGGDGVKAANDEDAGQGYVVIAAGTLVVAAQGDGVSAATALVVQGGDLSIETGGGSGAAGADGAKGLKAGTALFVTGGTIVVDAADDALHSDGSLAITDGTLSLASTDDGIHAETSLEIDGGTIDITECYEGLESTEITINGGEVHVSSTDDGINTVPAGQSAEAAMGQGGPGGGPAWEGGTSPLYVNGGYLYVDAGGDGIDANGPVTMTGGTLIVNGPTSDGNGALDFVSFDISGGFLVAVGSAGMAQAPGEGSQAVAGLAFRSAVAAGTMVHIQAEDGTDLLTFTPAKEYATVVLSSPDLVEGATCTVYTGGASTGTAKDGLYSGGEYLPGDEAGTFTA